MQVRVRVTWHVEVEHDVDLLDINATTEEFSGDKNARFELLKALVDPNSIRIQKWRDAEKGKRCNNLNRSPCVTYLSSRLILP